MILLSISVRAFGPFRGEARLATLRPGLNILAAPNEAGKSTLFLALHHGFFTSYKTADRALKDLMPWSTNLGPSVDIEFQHGPIRYRLRKCFLSGQSCSLSEWTGTRYEPKFQDEDADRFVRDTLVGTKPEKGAAKPEHAGLARLLWVPQGPASLAPPEPGQAVSSAIRATLGAVATDPAEERLMARLQAEYSGTYTGKTGQEAKGSALHGERQRLGERSKKLDEVRGQLDNLRSGVESLSSRLEQVRQLEIRVKDLGVETSQLEGEAAATAKLKADLQVAAAEHKAAEDHRDTTARDLEAHREAARKAADLAADLPARQDAALAAEQVAAKLGTDLLAAEAALAAANSELDRARDAYERASRQRQARADVEELARLRSRRVKANEAADKLAEIERLVGALPAVPEADRRGAATLQQEIGELRARMRAAGITVVFDLDPARRVEFRGSEGAGGGEAGPGSPLEAFTLDALQAEIAGVGRIHVTSGAGSARDIERQTEAKEAELSKLLGRHGVTAVADLEQRHADRQALEAEARTARDVLATLLEGHASAAAVQRAVADLEATLAARLAALGLTEEALAALELPGEGALEATGKAARAARDEQARAALDLKARHKEAEERAQAALGLVSTLEADRQRAQETASQILARYAGSVADLEKAAAEARTREAQLAIRVADLVARVPAPEADPERLLAARKATLAEAEADLRTDRDVAIGQKAVVESDSARGLYLLAAELEEEVEQLQAGVASLDARGRAVKLLLALAHERQRRQSAGLVGPLAARATQLWEDVTGIPGRRVVFGDDLTLRGVHVAGAERSIDPFSGGAREQLFLVSRLALGEVLARDGRQFMVIDDSLVNSDPQRRDRLVEVLADAARILQIVVLTCDGDRYRHLAAAEHLRLETPVEA